MGSTSKKEIYYAQSTSSTSLAEMMGVAWPGPIRLHGKLRQISFQALFGLAEGQPNQFRTHHAPFCRCLLLSFPCSIDLPGHDEWSHQLRDVPPPCDVHPLAPGSIRDSGRRWKTDITSAFLCSRASTPPSLTASTATTLCLTGQRSRNCPGLPSQGQRAGSHESPQDYFPPVSACASTSNYWPLSCCIVCSFTILCSTLLLCALLTPCCPVACCSVQTRTAPSPGGRRGSTTTQDSDRGQNGFSRYLPQQALLSASPPACPPRPAHLVE